MSEAQHTPGPYHIGKPGGPAGPFWSVINASGNVVAMQVMSEANAQLIAAAPDLLAACETMLVWMKRRNYDVIRQWPSGEVPCEEYKQLRAAVAKAKGESDD